MSSGEPKAQTLGELKRLRREIAYGEYMLELSQLTAARSRARVQESLTTGSWLNDYTALLGTWSQDSLNRFGGINGAPNGGIATLIRSENDLAILRTPAAILALTNTYAQGLLWGLSAYVIGEGMNYKFGVEHDELYPGLEEGGQKILDEILEFNDFGANNAGEGEQPSLELEAFQRFIVGGEAGVIENVGPMGMTELRTVEPWQLTQPPGSDFREWSFGILTDPKDQQRPLGYHIAYEVGQKGDELEPDEFTYIKNNAWRTQKRGITDFAFGMIDTLRLADTLRGNLGESAAQQAAIVGVEQPETGNAQEWTGGIANKAAANRTDPFNGQNIPYLFLRRGTWKRIPKGFTYAAGPGAGNAAAHLSILSGLTRAAATKYNAPEWLLSAEAAAQNYATSLTVNSLFVQRVKATQKVIRGPFRRLVERAVRRRLQYLGKLEGRHIDPATGAVNEYSYDANEVLRVMKITVVSPDPEYRDPVQVASKRSIEAQHGVISPQEWCALENRNFAQTAAEIVRARELVPDTYGGFAAPGGGDANAGGL